ncbi:MAG: hypothetical protein ACOC5R_03610 [Elusimicrobiota bacterium]
MNRFQYTEINEPVKAGVVFDKSKIRLRWFIWNNKKYNIKKITYNWIDTEQDLKLFCFSAWDGKNLYELSFNPKFLTWRLEKVYLE